MIKGWDNGLQDMCVGEKRKLVSPSDLGCAFASLRLRLRATWLPSLRRLALTPFPFRPQTRAPADGDRGSPPKIPGGATLVFTVELLAIKD